MKFANFVQVGQLVEFSEVLSGENQRFAKKRVERYGFPGLSSMIRGLGFRIECSRFKAGVEIPKRFHALELPIWDSATETACVSLDSQGYGPNLLVIWLHSGKVLLLTLSSLRRPKQQCGQSGFLPFGCCQAMCMANPVSFGLVLISKVFPS